MRRTVTVAVIAALAGSCISSSAFPESVFDEGRLRAPRVALESPGAAGGFAALGAVSGGAVAPEEGEPAGEISAKAAAGWSLLLPGLGQQRAGHPLRAKVYYAVEAAVWISVASFVWMGYDRENTYKDYAVVYGDVSGTDHSDDYYRTIGEYPSSDGPDGYNEAVRREARDLYYPDVAAMESYYRSNIMTGDESWAWTSESEYRRYGDIRDGSRFAYRIALYAALGAVALRIVSAADAVRTVHVDQSPPANEGVTSIGIEPRSRGIALCVKRSF
jgi:hypothetical protein